MFFLLILSLFRFLSAKFAMQSYCIVSIFAKLLKHKDIQILFLF